MIINDKSVDNIDKYRKILKNNAFYGIFFN